MQTLGAIFTRLGVLTAHPGAFLIVVAYVVMWLFFSPQTLEWHGVVTMATLFMTLLIQRAEHRDTQAIHAKLDELLRHSPARNELTHLDQLEPEQIQRHRSDQD